MASIREQLCIVYSAVDDKQASDYNRNLYLDLQDQTRQDRYYEARATSSTAPRIRSTSCWPPCAS